MVIMEPVACYLKTQERKCPIGMWIPVMGDVSGSVSHVSLTDLRNMRL